LLKFSPVTGRNDKFLCDEILLRVFNESFDQSLYFLTNDDFMLDNYVVAALLSNFNLLDY
jgi:hypothetical protein